MPLIETLIGQSPRPLLARLIEKIDYEDGCGLEEATRRARIEAPALAKALNLMT